MENIEQEREQVAEQFGVPIDQVEVLSKEVQETGVVEQPLNEDGEREMKEFLSKEENREHALQLARQIEQVCGNKWFPIERLISRSAETKQTAFHKLKLCELFGFISVRIGDWKDDRKLIREPLYKVITSLKAEIEAIDRIIEYHEDQVHDMKIKRNFLENKLQQPGFQSNPAPNN